MAIKHAQNSQEFRQMIEDYKRQNPYKYYGDPIRNYPGKKDELERKLRLMEEAEGIAHEEPVAAPEPTVAEVQAAPVEDKPKAPRARKNKLDNE